MKFISTVYMCAQFFFGNLFSTLIFYRPIRNARFNFKYENSWLRDPPIEAKNVIYLRVIIE